MSTKYSALGRRLRVFFITKWDKGEAAFCDALGVTKSQLEKYFSGKKNPAELFQPLAMIGADLHYIATGEHKEGLELIMSLDKLQQKGIINYRGMCKSLIEGKKCAKCHAADEPFGATVEWINSIYQRSLN